MLEVRRDAFPLLAVDHVGGVAEPDYRPGHVVRYFVIPAADGQQGPGGANVHRAVLQRQVVGAGGNEQGLRAQPLNDAAQGGGVSANLLALEIFQRLQRLIAEEPLVRPGKPVAVDNHAPGFFRQHPLDVGNHIHQGQIGGFPVRPHAP